jgi:hypothetical protein
MLPTQGYTINVDGIPINIIDYGMGDCALAWNTKVKAQCATVTRITIASASTCKSYFYLCFARPDILETTPCSLVRTIFGIIYFA